MTEYTPDEAKSALAAFMEKHGLTIKAEFVPWSQSRSKGDTMEGYTVGGKPAARYSLNWRVTLLKRAYVYDGPSFKDAPPREILTTDYMAGIAHIPGWRTFQKYERLAAGNEAIRLACEEGRCLDGLRLHSMTRGLTGVPGYVMPDSVGVFSSLCMDVDVIDYANYESWAGEFGYDSDSRKGEAVYRACLEIALKLRAALGDEALTEAREISRHL